MFKFEIKEKENDEASQEAKINERDEADYDISNLIDLLNQISFSFEEVNHQIQKSEGESLNFSKNSSEMFKFSKTSNNKSESEIKEMSQYFENSRVLIKSDSCKED